MLNRAKICRLKWPWHEDGIGITLLTPPAFAVPSSPLRFWYPGSSPMTGERGKGTSALHLDEETFRRACRRFVQHSHALSDGWSWEEVKGSDEGYMRKTVLVPGGPPSFRPKWRQ
ncbi:hypothetical protein ANANG_G00195360 [Anguilla anguilla]|uniref:Uncharacterized protein n=1 Tax=Anguilla anguilla TaxID=7936 RepID=A0A9D3M1V3_ANGAN|nr:hypothetical protein ANANG_G00195360 [Anguilla anguilla]